MYLLFKRGIDLLGSLTLIILLSPFFLLLSIWIKVDSRGPVLFRQERVGKNKKHFKILKFRTMRTDTPRDMPTHLLEHPDTYITRAGKFLRKTSLDELPQLINIIKGEMSFVGPRPALWNQHDLIAERDRYGANDIVPGLTGWAQVNGRDELPIELKAKYDGEYVKRRSAKFDLYILCKTIISVIRRDGIQEGANSAAVNKMNIES